MNPTHAYESVNEVLQAHGLKRTPARQAILALFQDREVALSHSEVERSLQEDLDRATVYRTLVSFEEKGLIHRVLGPDGVVKFAGCQSGCDEYGHFDDHVHFHCRECGDTFCLTDMEVPTPPVSGGHFAETYQLSVEGVCGRCRSG